MSISTRKTELFIFLVVMLMLLPLDLIHQAGKVDLVQPQVMYVLGEGGGGASPKTLTRVMTKICDIPYPIYDLN